MRMLCEDQGRPRSVRRGETPLALRGEMSWLMVDDFINH